MHQGPDSAGRPEEATPATPPADAGEERRARRRERLLATATELFAERGYAATSIERICATAHVSIRAFYEEFQSREALLIALHDGVARGGMDAVLAALDDPATVAADTRTRIAVLVGAYVGAVTVDPAATRTAFAEVIGAGRGAEEHGLLWRSLWADFLAGEVERAVGRGEALPRDYTLAMVAFIGAVCELLAHWARNSGAFSRELLAGEVIHQALAVLGAAAAEEGK
ncbi:TetR/AcrR family transcriptional regulator [Streptomyces sp. NPDC088725]|uniref:TetR/AcrR family transcriptional regulator n=1 Tax=Streptomyces sp. NPDC088725 TaxID=3365873 RepID=UPI00382F3940